MYKLMSYANIKIINVTDIYCQVYSVSLVKTFLVGHLVFLNIFAPLGFVATYIVCTTR